MEGWQENAIDRLIILDAMDTPKWSSSISRETSLLSCDLMVR